VHAQGVEIEVLDLVAVELAQPLQQRGPGREHPAPAARILGR
jgi:hypothetical protein